MKRQSLLTSAMIFLSFTLSAQHWDTLAEIPADFTFPVVTTVLGKIHIMGGGGTNGATTLHYAYDPTADRWDRKADVPYRAQQPAGATAEGMIHFFGGGFPNSGSPLDSHYIYDPQNDTWQAGTKLTSPRAIHSALGFQNRIYNLGGQGVSTLFEYYDTNNNLWIPKANLPDANFWYGAHVATENHIYRFCGGGFTRPNALSNKYDPTTDEWISLPSFPNAVHAIKGTAIGHKIYLAGGYYNFKETDEVWIFDVNNEAYSKGPNMPIGRNYHSMVSIDSCIYVVGGNNAIDPTVRRQLIRWCPFQSTSVSDNSPDTKLQIVTYSDHIEFQIHESNLESTDIMLTDASGRVTDIKNHSVFGNTMVIPTQRLSTGMYIIQVRFKNQIYTGRFVHSRI